MPNDIIIYQGRGSTLNGGRVDHVKADEEIERNKANHQLVS